jgi:diguanylate cyclase
MSGDPELPDREYVRDREAEDALMEDVRALLEGEDHRSDPLHVALSRLYRQHEALREHVDRLVRISDAYHEASRERNRALISQHNAQLRRLEKLARISDRYQNSLREVAETLEVASLEDPLTGLGNRRYLMRHLRQEAERALRRQSPLSVGVLDVDHFKRINDTFGHEVGDTALCEIAGAISENLRTYDLCGRWGGEEFLLIFPDTELEPATMIAERVNAVVSALRPDMPGDPLPISASIGLARMQPDEDILDTVNRADAALMEAKRAGRGRVCTA